jgi:hypothetical protein
VDAQATLGGPPRDRVDPGQLVLEDLPEARGEVVLEPVAVLEDGVDPARSGSSAGPCWSFSRCSTITVALLSIALLLASPKPSTSSMRVSRSNASKRRARSRSA